MGRLLLVSAHKNILVMEATSSSSEGRNEARSVIDYFLSYLEKTGASATNEEFENLVSTAFPNNKWSRRYWHHYRSLIRKGKYANRVPDSVKVAVATKASSASQSLSLATPPNHFPQVEQKLAECVASVAYFMSPRIVEQVALRNADWAAELCRDFPNRFDHAACFYSGSASVFGPVRRKENKAERQLAPQRYYLKHRAIIDLNWFPREAVSFICTGSRYTAKRWKSSGLAAFELAHILPHKAGEVENVAHYFSALPPEPFPYGLFTCVSNVALIPKGMAKPTDLNGAVRLAFMQKYFELYGEPHAGGFRGLKIPPETEWIKHLPWRNDCVIEPADWFQRVDRLDKFRRSRLRALLKGEEIPGSAESDQDAAESDDEQV